MFTTGDVLREASVILMDDGANGGAAFTRYRLPVLLSYINAGIRQMVLHKPNDFAEAREVELDEGPLQSLPADATQLLRTGRSLVSRATDDGGRRGPQIVAIDATALDNFLPGWDDPAIVPWTAEVKHLIHDLATPRQFRVYPGNDGTGVVELYLAVLPPRLAIAQNADANLIASYVQPVPIHDVLQQALVDWVLHRAYAMEMDEPGAAARSGAHLKLFEQALGIKLQGEVAASPRTAPGQGG